jgi:hypothetical protein
MKESQQKLHFRLCLFDANVPQMSFGQKSFGQKAFGKLMLG